MEEVDILISGGTILTLDEKDTKIQEGALAIKGDTITAVGNSKEIEISYSGGKTIDAQGCLVMPGFINGHTHAAMTCFRGLADDLELMDWLNNYIFPAEAKNVNEELAYWGSLLACAEMIRSGTTTFCDMYIFENETAKAAKKAGARCLLGEVLFDFPSPNSKSPEEGLEYTRKLIETWKDDPLVNIVVEPHSLYTCSPSLLRNAKDLADQYNVPLATHLLENRGEVEQLKDRLGKKATIFLRDMGLLDDHFIAFHCVCMDEEDIKLFAEHGSKIVHNPESNMKLASGVAPVTRMLDHGVPVGLGTDGCASNNNLDMMQEMDAAAKLHKVFTMDPTVMDAKTVLRMATAEGARALGMESEIGILRPGMKADIILVDFQRPHLTPMYDEYSALVYSANGADVKSVIINGAIVMENNELLTISEHEVMDKVNEISERVKRGMGLK
ncbi:MAG: amidohydrolase [Thermodesulfobacteriota bacterium]|nr:amidohydrolase [Thermodesulfobacteriota bacterium]